ncbi:DUF6154 family protein [Heyndrickxia acidicola]|uniref:DUF6154 family protein n=1 Tax=Heyndrickxia acidicola TaxID=209389 RepID=A0ABU6MST2_9BACI|nr:DUF6154 family protein [Heyndrickxia acidicola]MED1206070.1 DUF6154 family protein [Heyndrickxia acidicola]
MRLVDELYEVYKNRLTGDEEDLDIITFAVLESSNRKELLEIVNDMNDKELQHFINLYLVETLKGKFAQAADPFSYPPSNYLH